MVDVQSHLPAVRSLPNLGDATAELAAQGPVVRRIDARRGDNGSGGSLFGAHAGQWADIAWPAGGAHGPFVPVFGDEGHPKGLVKEAAAPMPVPEGIPAGAVEESEGDLAF